MHDQKMGIIYKSLSVVCILLCFSLRYPAHGLIRNCPLAYSSCAASVINSSVHRRAHDGEEGGKATEVGVTLELSLVVGLVVVTVLSVVVTDGLGGSSRGTSVVTSSPAH